MDFMMNAVLVTNLTQQGKISELYGDLADSKNHVVDARLSPLSPLEINLRIQALSDWTTDGTSLFYTHTFRDFVEAIQFVNSLVDPAEQLGHHPDITINYNQVFLELTTHDAGGLTELDFQLAEIISHL